MLLLPVLCLVAVIKLNLRFLYSLRVVVSMHWRYLKCCQVILLLLFLTVFVCLRHLWNVRSYVSSWVFLFYHSFVEVSPSSTLWMVLSILRRGQPRCLHLWWDFWYVVWFQVVLLRVFFFSFFFHLRLFDGFCFQYSLLRSFWFFLDLAVLFLLEFVIFCFSLLACHIFLCQIPSLYIFPVYAKFHPYIFSLYIFTTCIRVSNSFFILANSLMSSMYIRWLIFFSCNLWSLYPPMHL